jgi:hypothetical protein
MAFKWPAKDPNERLDYEHDWAARLEGDVIQGLPEALVETGDVAIDSTTLEGTVQKVWLTGGTVKASGEPERLTLRVTTAGGRIFDEGILVPIKQR